MIGRTNVGIGNIHTPTIIGFIHVTYPVGSICTCSKGTTMLTAEDTSGYYIFNVAEVGTWTIAATDGTAIKEAEITVSAGESYRIKLMYALYDAGDGEENWSLSANRINSFSRQVILEKNADHMWLTGYNSSGVDNGLDNTSDNTFAYGVVSYNDPIDFSSVDSVRFQGAVKNWSTRGYNLHAYLYLTSDPTIYPTTAVKVAEIEFGNSIADSTTEEQDITLDTSSISGTYYIALTNKIEGGHTSRMSLKIDKVWTE